MINYSELQNTRNKLKNMIPLCAPFGLFIDPSNHCNFHCSFCPRNQPDFSEYAGKFCNMSYDLFAKILTDIKDFGQKLKVVRLYYLGEPLINKDFVKMLDTLIKAYICDRIEVTSNGSLLNNDIADKIIDVVGAGETPVYFRFSIYAITGGGGIIKYARRVSSLR